MHELAKLNTLLSRYVLRFLDADAGRVAPLSTADERALAERMVDAAADLQAKAARRERHRDGPIVVEEGDTEDGEPPEADPQAKE